jgi:TetR/AcrR family transcriptional regulator
MQRELKREALLRAAVSAFSRQGFHQTSLDEIAQKLGVTKAALYYYFPNKNAVLAACFDRAMKVANESLAQARKQGRNGREALQLYLRNYLEAVTDEFGISVLLTEEHSLEDEDRKKLFAERDKLEGEMRSLVREGIRDGSIVRCDPKLAVFLLLGAVNWIPKWFLQKGSWTNHQLAKAVTDMLDRMLSTNPCLELVDDVGKVT